MSTILAVIFALVGILSVYIYTTPKSPPLKLSDLPSSMQQWYKKGRHYEINGYKMFTIIADYTGPPLDTDPPTIILVHGFPSSSYDYHKAVALLRTKGRIVMFDHVGFGFSERPRDQFTYSLIEHAENALMLWDKLSVQNIHIISHDMGDSVITELLVRYEKGMIPASLKDTIKSVTFTNGGMRYDMINFRISQTLLRIPYLRDVLIALPAKFPSLSKSTRQQMLSIWGPVKDLLERDKDIDELNMMNAFNLNASENGLILDRTIYYLYDRSVYEGRWMKALKRLHVPLRFVWGDSDAVSPVTIPQSVRDEVAPSADITILKGLGHFLMLEDPERWTLEVTKHIK